MWNPGLGSCRASQTRGGVANGHSSVREKTKHNGSRDNSIEREKLFIPFYSYLKFSHRRLYA